MTKLEILQKEAREKLLKDCTNEDCDACVRDGVVLDDLISSAYRAAIEDAKGVMPAKKITGFAGFYTTGKPVESDTVANIADGMEKRGFNTYRTEALKNLDELMPGV